MEWKFECYNETDDPQDGYYTLDAGPLCVVIEPDNCTVVVWLNSDLGDAVLADHTAGFASLDEAKQIAANLLEATLNRWQTDIRAAMDVVRM